MTILVLNFYLSMTCFKNREVCQKMKKTALELTPQEWQAYQPARALEGRRQNTAEHLGQRKQRAWRVAHQAAHILRNEFQAEKVVVFGSLAHKAWFTLWSDVDLAVWGIPPDRFYPAVAAVTELSSDVTIDLIDPEDACRPSLRVAIERDGIEL
jgi:predicted nucleotidyltransferase